MLIGLYEKLCLKAEYSRSSTQCSSGVDCSRAAAEVHNPTSQRTFPVVSRSQQGSTNTSVEEEDEKV